MTLQASYDQLDQELDQEEKKRGPGRPKGSTSKSKGKTSSGSRSSGSTPKKSPGRPSMWLEKKEAEILSKAIQYGILVRYGTEPSPPSKQAEEHLAHIIKKYSETFPLRHVQGFIRSLLPIADPSAKPGRSTFGDFMQYLAGWHYANPELYQELLGAEGIYIPFLMEPPPGIVPDMPAPAQTRIPAKKEVEASVGRRLSTEEYLSILQRDYGVTTHHGNGG